MQNKGYFGIGIERCKTAVNYGTLFRTAQILNAGFVFVIGQRFVKQSSDTMKSFRHLPTYSYNNFNHFLACRPYSCQLVGIEMDKKATLIETFKHPKQAIYLLGSEDNGLSKEALGKCQSLICLQGNRSMNVAVAGSIIMYDRITKLKA